MAPDGDVVFSLTAFSSSGPQSVFRQIDAHTGKVSILFTTAWVEHIAIAPTLPTPPVAANDSYATTRGATLSIGAGAGVLKNDTDPAGGRLTASLVHGPAHGTLLLRPDGSFRYTPRAGFTGTDTFTYRASDGSLYSAPATVTIHVHAVPPLEGAKGHDPAQV